MQTHNQTLQQQSYYQQAPQGYPTQVDSQKPSKILQKDMRTGVWIGLMVVPLLALAGLFGVINIISSDNNQAAMKVTIKALNATMEKASTTIFKAKQLASTPKVVAFDAYAVIPANTQVFDAPTSDSTVIETTKSSGVVGWQNKTENGKWLERKGGGWVAAKNYTNYSNLDEALAALTTSAPSTTNAAS
ncbi:MAG: hypothetical protein HXX08_09030 [Chloroflexi bacterium]|uniref:Uncharacterized protein n=1 Tax=Candidatus Chlorohelix allophototropha TaxID=3003348 RepID=A0A8T7LYJ2_9CHLR|nr:hypothetical protein [Chloroflexota bacterium]WJW67867.1 hypothetical protein OZ401_001150 [Chloroflexota bacterium L227-S17]